jgi:branched-chain amino acid transport system substrate-binding protein
MKAWVKWTNAHGGINGYCLNYTFLDDQSSGTLALADVKQLVQQDHIIALLGNLDEQTSWVQYIDSTGVPVIGGDNDTFYYATDKNFYPTGGVITTLLEGIVEAAKAAGKPKIALFYCVNIADCTALPGLFKSNAKATGANLVYSGSFNYTAPNYTPLCIAAKQAGAQDVYASAAGAQFKMILQQCALQNFHPTILGVDGTMSGDEGGPGGLSDALFNSSDVPFFDQITPVEKDLHQAMSEYYPQALVTSDYATDFWSLEWASGELFKAAAEAAHLGANPTAAQVKAGLATISNNTLGGLTPPLTFTPGSPRTGNNCFFVEAIKNGVFQTPQGEKYTCLPAAS